MAVAFKWGNGSLGNAGGILDTTATLGVTNKAVNNGAIAAGDLIIGIVNVHAAADPGAVSVDGLTTLYDNFVELAFSDDLRVWVGYKLASASEAGSYVATWTDTAACGWVLLCFSGVGQTNPISASAHQSYPTASQTHLAPSVTPTSATDMWVAIEARVGANAPDTPSAPLVGAYDIGSNSGGRPEISTAYLQLASAAPTGVGTFTQAAFTQGSQGISLCLAAVPQIITQGQTGGAGSVSGRKRKKHEQYTGPAFAAPVPLSKLYKPVQFFDFEEDDETVVLLTI